MDKNEAQMRLKGADDMIILARRMFIQMFSTNGKVMTEKDIEDSDNFFGSLRNLLEESYKRKVAFSESLR
jgi:hypothetical protein